MPDAIALDRYVVETLMPDLVGHDRRPAAFLVYLALASDQGRGRGFVSHAQLAERTGLSKRTVQDALRHLAARSLVAVDRGARTEAACLTVLTPWRREGRPA